MNTHDVQHLCLVQVYMADDEKSPRCLHQWNPHDGKPLSALFFLDNHKHHSPEYVRWFLYQFLSCDIDNKNINNDNTVENIVQ